MWGLYDGPATEREKFLGRTETPVPFGWSAEGLPFAVQQVGRHFDETTVLRAAAGLEAAQGADTSRGGDRQPPGPSDQNFHTQGLALRLRVRPCGSTTLSEGRWMLGFRFLVGSRPALSQT